MPVYDYLCRRCGPFTDMRPMADCDLPSACPGCGRKAPRAFLTAPYCAAMSAERRLAQPPMSATPVRRSFFQRWRTEPDAAAARQSRRSLGQAPSRRREKLSCKPSVDDLALAASDFYAHRRAVLSLTEVRHLSPGSKTPCLVFFRAPPDVAAAFPAGLGPRRGCCAPSSACNFWTLIGGQHSGLGRTTTFPRIEDQPI